MADLLIANLKKKCELHSALMPLLNQWGFDEELIPKALQTIGNLFPHYSRHDVSHSLKILTNIERLLGPSLESLSATDTWLLLECAFLHDVGMVVPQKDIDEVFTQEEFQAYLYSIKIDSSHELFKFATHFNAHNLSTCFLGAESPVHAIECLRNLLAEWFRRKHAERARVIVESPWQFAGINSPRTELIPARLFRHLGTICHLHGMAFNQLVNDDLIPFREMGLGLDDCHPRFVACLLRLGDLLDIDDNRFCPVLQQIAGHRRPALSKVHEEKHSSIRQLRIDRERIEILSICETIPAYLETYKWFDWLKSEFQQQMAFWQDIVPSREFGLLPTIGKIDVRIRNNFNVLADGQRPQFSIDAVQATELLRGSGLYVSRFDFVRELLQNAVDATLLSFWLTSGQKDSKKYSEPSASVLKELRQKLKVEVNLHEVQEKKNGKTLWCLCVRDTGTGISREDLPYLLQIGSGQKNHTRQSWISTMPEWMKPSGAFGIGFQSVFMLAEEVKITTKSILTSETLQMTLHSPMSKASGLVEIETKSNDFLSPYGTCVEVNFLLDTFSKKWNLSWRHRESIASRLVENVDTMLDKKFQYEAGKLATQIFNFSEESLIDIVGIIKIQDWNYEISMHSRHKSGENLPDWKHVGMHGVSLQYKPTGVVPVVTEGIECFYRGQAFEQNYLILPHLQLRINILRDRASDWLSVNRNNLSDSATKNFKKLVFDSLSTQIKLDVRKLQQLTEKEQADLSFFLEAMCTAESARRWVKLSHRLQDKWLDLTPYGGEVTFREYLGRKRLLVGVGMNNAEKLDCDLILDDDYFNYTLSNMIQHWTRQANHSVQLLAPKVYEDLPLTEKRPKSKSRVKKENEENLNFAKLYLFERHPQPLYSQMALCLELARKLRTVHGNERYFIPWQEFLPSSSRILLLKSKVKINADSLFPLIPAGEDYVLLPYLFRSCSFSSTSRSVASITRLEEFVDWISLSLREEVSQKEIRQSYVDLVSYIEDLMLSSPFKKFWNVESQI